VVSTEICLECECPATIHTAWGDWLCEWCLNHGPNHGLQCPFCPPSQVVTFVGAPVADVDEQPDEAPDALSPSASGATTLDLPQVQGGPLSPVSGVLPPETSGTGGTLADQLQALTWCVTRAYDSKEAPAGLIAAADAGLLTFERLIRAVGGAR